MPEVDPLVLAYSHLKDLPRSNDALHTLKKIASVVKPLMRARGWKVNQLAEFYPDQQNLLGKAILSPRLIHNTRLRY
jgi:DNA-dependent metalloprotease WSS1